ncbi:binding-protein-dependent transport system inner membrane protein [Celeribacter indicus]|uniref:Binding-protein-dependent transport system inner membrane protein n=1 Tax=Celeribacter indicus TaxID=1208324 RepID=A0A0B5E6Y7_9RHOB|nr:binding-protein-dependent transport system inner membrane protein [Celeribacter indicus]
MSLSAPRRRAVGGWLRGLSLRAAVVFGVLAFWQVAGYYGVIPATTLPAFTDVMRALADLITSGDLSEALPISLQRALLGFTIGSAIGVFLGVFSGLWKIDEEIVDAPMQIFRAIPFIALLPLFITWFGIGELSKIILIIFATIFPAYINTYGGVRNVDRKLVESARVFELSPPQIALRVILPTSLPSVIVGLRYSSSTALLALVVSEQLNATSGIGYLLMTANQQQHSAIVIALVIVYAMLGIMLDGIWRLFERLSLPWRADVRV